MIVDEYEILRGEHDELGRGSGGVVWKGVHRPTNDTVAVKSIKLDETTEEEQEYAAKYIYAEVEILQSLHHENIVKLLYSKKRGDFLYIFIEFCNQGDLAKFVKKETLTPKMKVSFLRDISRALNCLHTHNPVIVHRDVRPENMLVTTASSSETGYILKLTDFGFSRRAPPGSAAFSATFCGTDQWMAPEIRPGTDGHIRYNKSADVFSAGLFFHSLIENKSGEPLRVLKVDGLSVGESMSRKQIRGEKVTTPSITKASDDALQTIVKGVVIQMIDPDPKSRCSMQQVSNSIELAYASPSSSSGTLENAAEAATGAEGARAGARVEGAGAEAAELRVSKLNHIALTSPVNASLFFGPANFIVGNRNDPNYYYYDNTSSKFELVWEKKIPDGLDHNEYKQLSANNDIFTQLTINKVCQYNDKLSLIRKLPSPGMMLGLLPGCHDAVVSNYASSSTNWQGLTLSVAPLNDLLVPHHLLDTPDEGPYHRDAELYACGREDHRVAVILHNSPFVDIYSETGRYVWRTWLPYGAGRPGCSDTHLLVPLWDTPYIAVLSWEGELLQFLGPDELGLDEDDEGFAVSPVYDQRVSFWFGLASGGYQVNTYKIL